MRATLLERHDTAVRERRKRLTNWHRHFAILPVWVADGDCRWLEWVERKLDYATGSYDVWAFVEYRSLSKQSPNADGEM